MATIIGCSLSSFPSSRFHSFQHKTNPKFVNRHYRTIYDRDKSYQHTALVVGSGNQPQISDLQNCFHLSENVGKTGVVSFSKHAFSRDNKVILSDSERTKNSISWIIGPAVLVASFLFPPSSLCDLLLNKFGRTSLTIVTIIFLRESVFYSGVGVFLYLLNSLIGSIQSEHSANKSGTLTPQLEHEISSVVNLVLGTALPAAAMASAWQWTFPIIASAVGPHLVASVAQFIFEKQARKWKSPSRIAIPFIFQAYRMQQIHRATAMLTYVSFYSTSPVPILKKLSKVLALLFVICIWSFSTLVMRLLLQLSREAKYA
ncbi:unnamed protein product [Sphenostylis stenocarpa]|uniref:Transmembrane protein n=1 Tax=Sphenostylis stenocarpa TaxID=92480 RepID=A0AA86VXV3_9FABA|nr:unnamed protein product [Sphenostylis stenocarpa]